MSVDQIWLCIALGAIGWLLGRTGKLKERIAQLESDRDAMRDRIRAFDAKSCLYESALKELHYRTMGR